MTSKPAKPEKAYHLSRIMFAVVQAKVLTHRSSDGYREWLHHLSDDEFACTLRGYLGADGLLRAYVGDFEEPDLDRYGDDLRAVCSTFGYSQNLGLGCIKGTIGHAWQAKRWISPVAI